VSVARQEIRYCTAADGTRIAYATMGVGPPLVKVPNWFGVEYELDSPVWRHWLEEPARDHRLIRFDQRGCGLSDRDVEDVSLEAWVGDLEAVVDAAGVERFALFGVSQGGPVAIDYAARHPDRVTQLILYGAVVRGMLRRIPSEAAKLEALVTLIRDGWEQDQPAYRQLFTSMTMPDATQGQMQAMNEMERKSTTGEIAARIMVAIGSIDVTDRLPQVAAPTLILHAAGDQLVPFDDGRTLAACLPNARLVALDSRNHALQATEPAWQVLLSEVRAFLGSGAVGNPATPLPTRQAGERSLSLREIEVLRLLAEGKSNQQIADELVISTSTVAKHLNAIFAKLNLTNRTEAAAYAHRNRLV
jgi:pimeloyl-ACP methyl ester carboxylesterase